MLKLFKVLLLFLSFSVSAQIDLTTAPIADLRIPLNKNNFKIKIKNFTDTKVRAAFVKKSFRWVRIDEVLLVPKARLKFKISSPSESYHLEYKDKVFSFQKIKSSNYSEIYVSLFETKPILIKNQETTIAEITFVPVEENFQENILIDYTCSRNGIKVEGIDKEVFSLGCRTRRVGSFGSEKPMLEITWFSPTLRIKNSKAHPYHAVFLNRRPITFLVTDIRDNTEKLITIRARIPKRIHRVFTAYGLGPYTLETTYTSKETATKSAQKFTNTDNIAPALFLYFNYKISETASIRGFDAAVFKTSTFNNAGVYFGNDFAFQLDKKLYLTTLLGVQYLYFQFDSTIKPVSEAIFPQGIEFMYRHVFDIPNYIISGGLFFNPSNSIKYNNLWIRWGKKYFWELNYISWAKDDVTAKTWGLSIGFPFKGFL